MKTQKSESRKSAKTFGGSLLKGNAKTKRPLSIKEAIHLVLRSRRALGSSSMLHPQHSVRIANSIRHQAKQCGVRIYHFVNVGNHIHLVIHIQSRELYQKFIRSITGLIARIVLKQERGTARLAVKGSNDLSVGVKTKQRASRFWLARPFTRLVEWGRDFQNLGRYMAKNALQAQKSSFVKTEAQLKKHFVALGFDLTHPEHLELRQ